MQLLRSPARPQGIRFRVAEVSTPSATGSQCSCGKLRSVLHRICARIGMSTIEPHAPLPLRILRVSWQHLQLANQPLKSDQRVLSWLLQKAQKPRQQCFGALAGR